MSIERAFVCSQWYEC